MWRSPGLYILRSICLSRHIYDETAKDPRRIRAPAADREADASVRRRRDLAEPPRRRGEDRRGGRRRELAGLGRVAGRRQRPEQLGGGGRGRRGGRPGGS